MHASLHTKNTSLFMQDFHYACNIPSTYIPQLSYIISSSSPLTRTFSGVVVFSLCSLLISKHSAPIAGGTVMLKRLNRIVSLLYRVAMSHNRPASRCRCQRRRTSSTRPQRAPRRVRPAQRLVAIIRHRIITTHRAGPVLWAVSV